MKSLHSFLLNLNILLFAIFIASCGNYEPSEVQLDEGAIYVECEILNDSMYSADSAYVKHLDDLAWKYYHTARLDSFRIVAEEAWAITDKMREYKDDSLARNYHALKHGDLATIKLWEGKLDKAEIYMQKCIDLLVEYFGNYSPKLMEAYFVYNYIFMEKGDYEKAIECLQKGLHIERKVYGEGHYYVGNNLRQLGRVYQAMGNYENAIYYYQKAAENYKKTAPGLFISTWTNLSNAYLSAEQPHRSQQIWSNYEYKIDSLCENFQKDCAYRKFSNRLTNHDDLAKILTALNQPDSARYHLNKLMEFLNTHKKPNFGIGNAHLLYAKSYLIENDYPNALKHLNKAHEVFKIDLLKGNNVLIRTNIDIANVLAKSGKINESLGKHQKLLVEIVQEFNSYILSDNPTLIQLGNNNNLIDILYGKSQSLLLKYKLDSNTSTLENAFKTVLLADSLLEKKRKNYRRNVSKIQTVKTEAKVHELGSQVSKILYEKTRKQEYLNWCWAFSEKHRAAVLLESMRDEMGKSRSGIPPELTRWEEKYKTDIAFLEKAIYEEEKKDSPDSATVSEWHYKLYDVKKSHDSLLVAIEESNPDYYNLKYNSRQISVEELQSELDNQETLVEYFLGDSTLYTYVVDRSGFNIYEQEIDSTFSRSIERFRKFSSRPSQEGLWAGEYQQFVRDSRYLYEVLLEKPLDNEGEKNTLPSLIIIPDGQLNFLPFNLLLTRQPDGGTLAMADYRRLPYLITSFDIRYEYSATLMVENKKSRPSNLRRKLWNNKLQYCGFAPAYGDGRPILASRSEMDSIRLAALFPGLQRGELASLEHNIPEVEAVKQFFGGEAFTGKIATEANFKAMAPDADILHLAMHALTNDQEPLFSQLAFEKDARDSTNDGRLHNYELYNMRLKADLAVLSACNTGVGKLQKGEGVMSLSRAFKYAGCANVVMSLWTANDRATKDIIERFFDGLKSGKGKAEALCQAQRDFLKSSSQDYSHPYYWSTMVLIGDAEPMWFPGINPLLWMGALILLIGYVTWWWKLRN